MTCKMTRWEARPRAPRILRLTQIVTGHLKEVKGCKYGLLCEWNCTQERVPSSTPNPSPSYIPLHCFNFADSFFETIVNSAHMVQGIYGTPDADTS